MPFLNAVTKNLAISRFLCEYSGPFWGMFLKIRLDMNQDFVTALLIMRSEGSTATRSFKVH